jgi:hypothetical protein
MKPKTRQFIMIDGTFMIILTPQNLSTKILFQPVPRSRTVNAKGDLSYNNNLILVNSFFFSKKKLHIGFENLD